MAVVRSLEGTFYDVPDSELDRYKVPADQVKSLMEAAGQKLAGPGPQQAGQGQGGAAAGGSPQILFQYITYGPHQQIQTQAAPAEGEAESVEPQWHRHHYHYWYWVNWYNWANWYNWY